MIILVCGGRDFHNLSFIYNTLNAIHQETPIELLVQGGARGVDTAAMLWAETHEVPNQTVFPDYENNPPKVAPLLRNKKMLKMHDYDQVVAFPGGGGTAHMKEIAKRSGVPVVTYSPEE